MPPPLRSTSTTDYDPVYCSYSRRSSISGALRLLHNKVVDTSWGFRIVYLRYSSTWRGAVTVQGRSISPVFSVYDCGFGQRLEGATANPASVEERNGVSTSPPDDDTSSRPAMPYSVWPPPPLVSGLIAWVLRCGVIADLASAHTTFRPKLAFSAYTPHGRPSRPLVLHLAGSCYGGSDTQKQPNNNNNTSQSDSLASCKTEFHFGHHVTDLCVFGGYLVIGSMHL